MSWQVVPKVDKRGRLDGRKSIGLERCVPTAEGTYHSDQTLFAIGILATRLSRSEDGECRRPLARALYMIQVAVRLVRRTGQKQLCNDCASGSLLPDELELVAGIVHENANLLGECSGQPRHILSS
jgi:hypothetical protein